MAFKVYEHYRLLFLWRRSESLPATRVGGFAWTEWELHNRERVLLSAAAPKESRPHRLVKRFRAGVVRREDAFLHIQMTSGCLNALRNCERSRRPVPDSLGSGSGSQFATERSKMESRWRVAVLHQSGVTSSWTLSILSHPPNGEYHSSSHVGWTVGGSKMLVSDRRTTFVRDSS